MGLAPIREGLAPIHEGLAPIRVGARPISKGVEVPIVLQKQKEHIADIGLEAIDTKEGPVEAVQTGSVTPDPTSTSPSTSMTEDAASTDTQETQTSGESQPTAEAPQKKRRKSKGRWVSIEEISPKPSYWPLVLTISIALLLMGIIIHPIVIGVGALLVIVSVMGWMLERR